MTDHLTEQERGWLEMARSKGQVTAGTVQTILEALSESRAENERLQASLTAWEMEFGTSVDAAAEDVAARSDAVGDLRAENDRLQSSMDFWKGAALMFHSQLPNPTCPATEHPGDGCCCGILASLAAPAPEKERRSAEECELDGMQGLAELAGGDVK